MSEELMQSEGVEVPETTEAVSETTADVTQNVTDESAPIEGTAAEDSGEVSSNPENAKKRIDKKSRKMQRRIDELESRVQSFESQGSYQDPNLAQPQYQPQAEHTQPASIVDPIYPDQYLTPGNGRYDAALLQQQQEQLAQQRSVQQKQQESMHYQRQQDEKFFDALDDASDRYEDFDDVVRNDNLPLTEAMLGVAKIAPNGADLLYYLAKNPKEVQRIANLHPVIQQREVAKHAIQFASQNNVSKAPAPVQPVGETPGGKTMSSFNRVAQSSKDLKSYFKEKERRGKR